MCDFCTSILHIVKFLFELHVRIFLCEVIFEMGGACGAYGGGERGAQGSGGET